MKLFKSLFILILMLQPFIGYLSYNLFGLPPSTLSFPILSIIIVIIAFSKGKIKIPKYLKYLGYFIIIELISKYIINSVSFSINVDFRISLTFITSFISLIIVENCNFKRDDINLILKIFIGLILVSLIVSILQYFSPSFFVNPERITENSYIVLDPDHPERRIASIFTWVDNMNLFIFSIPISLNLYLGWVFLKNKKIRQIDFLVVGIVGVLCLLSKSRNFLLMYIVVVFYYLYKSIGLKTFLQITVSLTILFVTIQFINFDIESYIEDRLLSESYLTRIQAFYVFFEVFPSNFLWGTGGQVTEELHLAYGRITRMHNGYLGLLYYYGLIGGLFYSLFLIKLYKRYNIIFRKKEVNILFISFACFCLGNLAVDYIYLFDFSLILTVVFAKYFRGH